MVTPPATGSLLGYARNSILGAVSGNGSTIQEILQNSTPGFAFLQAFFKNWLKLDISTIAAILTIFGTISGGVKDLQGLALKLYWWFTKFFSSSISVASNDRLNREIVNWLGAQVLENQGTRILTARSDQMQTDAWQRRRGPGQLPPANNRAPIQYLPTFGTTWFYHERSIFLVRRIPKDNRMAQSNGVPDEYASAPEGDEPLVVMCLGRSVKPIKRFLETCRDFAERQRDAYVTVRSSKMIQFHQAWDTMILRPIRPLDTVHLDEVVKANLVNDIRNYLDNKTKRFYENRGIPYRRGYLLYGPPGTGKTSLSLALAGLFGLELYLLHIPGVREDSELEKLFTTLPPKCLVLLEDIDAIGTARQLDIDDGVEDEEYAKISGEKKQRCTLSGLLNVLDGVSSQEGRVVLMTSNVAHKLDKALIRPGRIDRMVYLGYINEKSASLMYLRMFERDDNQKLENDGPDEVELQKLAIKFSSNVPEETFTPAQLQGFLLNHRESPELAVSEISTWVSEEITKMKDAKEHANQVAALRAKRRTGHMLQVLGQSIAVSNEDSSKNRDEIVLDATLGAQKKSSGGTTKG